MDGQNPNITPGDWFAIGCLFGGPFRFDDDLSSAAPDRAWGCQTLVGTDVASQCVIHHQPLKKPPGHFTANEIVDFVRQLISKHGQPRIGIVLAPSAWQSSHELLMAEETKSRGEWLRDRDIDIPPMPNAARAEIRFRIGSMGMAFSLGAEFD